MATDSAAPSPARLTHLFEPRSIALIGASDRSNWSHRIVDGLRVIGYDGALHYVNPKGGEAHGQPLVRSVTDIEETPDLAFVMVPASAVLEAMRDIARAGITSAIVLSSGFAELGDEGRRAQEELRALAAEHGITVLGPNALGYVNTDARVALKPFPPGEPLRSGSIAVVSQSGNVTVQLLNMARSFDIGVSLAVSTGNEMDVRIADVVDFLVDHEATRVITVFTEAFPDPHAFLAACRRARAAGKLVVCLKAGRSEAAARAALAHTGSLVGNDAVIDAFLRSAGVVRVSSLEDLLVVADTFAHTGPIDGAMALLTISGGTCDIVADAAEDIGLELAELAGETVTELKQVLPELAAAQNPLDVTGAAVTDATLMARTLAVVARDPGVGVVLVAQEMDHQAENLAWGREALERLSAEAAAAACPAILANTTVRYVNERVREIRAAAAAPTVFGGVSRILPAIAAIGEWTTRAVSTEAEEFTIDIGSITAPRQGTWSEATSRALLESAGVPVVPAVVAASPAAAAAAAADWEGRVALKVVSDDIVHKSDVGGVALDIAPDEVEDAATTLLRRVSAAVPDATIDGVLVTPMREPGVDLLVGVIHEAGWGHVLAVGLGGIWAEVFGDVQRIALPASPAQFEAALRRLRAWPLLDGVRGAEPVDLSALVEILSRIAALAVSLGDDMAAVEVNPLRARGTQIEALDAAVVWNG
ncbi:hypothetical protein BHE97_08710 [Aeromicrobium sp. PE09-221]|uniref:acetate--CoA ligase family protein n=1 Tax=Aeromicrobium sp. PE09-221 TaxID=1898043 RepID=UPI000B3EB3E3|nr:acetate--CoA ligase family protein [Aeromicrobium sp. PE09-221]OUZ10127.1 hypothetical protein BHE97_08710 [Aeromicrobium sp. PE09-221]